MQIDILLILILRAYFAASFTLYSDGTRRNSVELSTPFLGWMFVNCDI